jgi:hypothetical protein
MDPTLLLIVLCFPDWLRPQPLPLEWWGTLTQLSKLPSYLRSINLTEPERAISWAGAWGPECFVRPDGRQVQGLWGWEWGFSGIVLGNLVPLGAFKVDLVGLQAWNHLPCSHWDSLGRGKRGWMTPPPPLGSLGVIVLVTNVLRGFLFPLRLRQGWGNYNIKDTCVVLYPSKIPAVALCNSFLHLR